MSKIDLLREIRELKNHLSYSKNIGFFFGAGTSCALNFLISRNSPVRLRQPKGGAGKDIPESSRTTWKTQIQGAMSILRDILNQLRSIRELTKESESKNLSRCLRKKMQRRLMVKYAEGHLSNHHQKGVECFLMLQYFNKRFFAWYNLLNRDFNKRGLHYKLRSRSAEGTEASEIPYFDGFVGSFEPFFWQESVDHQAKHGEF